MSTDADITSDQQPGCLHPRERYDLVGQEAAEQAFCDAWSSGRLHHAWLITGPRGVGKATWAWRAARRVLGARPDDRYGVLGSSPDDPVCQTIEAEANPDLLLLRRPYDDKRKRWRAEITIDEARRAPEFFSKSAGQGGWRVCLVDAADDMNVNSANALLKTLEEPPHRGILFLLAHSPGRLPATIRSRCRKLDLRPPEAGVTRDWLSAQSDLDDPSAIEAATTLARNAPGRALALIQSGGVSMAREVDSMIRSGAKLSDSDIRRMADQLSAKGSEARRPVFYENLQTRFKDEARSLAADGEDPTPWLKAWDEVSALVRDADALYLDAKQTALSAIGLIRQASAQVRAARR